ncbi:MAG: hypothetical protein EA409_00155 [Saprospirales bacterium]|nr:MAG: hypothetical protein EA409_00155 [Saprospirales bacterium]
MRLNTSPDSFGEGMSVDIESEATAMHEYMHFFQTIFTGYGHIAWDSHRQITSFLYNEWSQASAIPNQKRRLPLAHYAKLGLEQLMHAVWIERSVLEMINLCRARFWLPSPNVTLQELGLKLRPYPWLANPTITVNGTSHVLQGKEITEGHAHFVEATYLEQIHDIDRSKIWDKSILPKQYWIAFEWFLEECGEEKYSEFPFICDLAMQISWDPVVPTTEEQWRASNPAWRFVKLVQALKEEKSLNIGLPEEWPKKYDFFASTLLGKCDFHSLEQIFSERLASFKRKKELLNLEALMEKAIRFRQANPWCGGNPMADLNLWKQMTQTFRVPIIEIGGKLGSFGTPDTQINTEAVMELQFQAFAVQILGEFSRSAVREKAIECAFSRFDIPQGCEFQRTHFCSGRYSPSDGAPFPVERAENDTLKGCSFEMLLNTAGLRSTDLDVDHAAKLPTDEELKVINRKFKSNS